MTRDERRPPVNRQIVDEAAEWFVDINEGEADSATRQRFHAWLLLSPEHVRAYLEMLPIWEEGAQLDTNADDLQKLIDEARRCSNVVSLAAPAMASSGASDIGTRGSESRSTASPARGFAYSVAAFVTIIAAGLFLWMQMFGSSYHTGIGEQRVIALEDGSQIEINSRSKVNVRFSAAERSVDLIEGQALFRVAKDESRPFVVHSGGTSVRAVGTQFDVYRKAVGTIVTVVEGKVAVTPPSSLGLPKDMSVLAAGEQVIIAPSVSPVPRRTDVAAATAWTQQRLVFSTTPLMDVVDEFNRYNKLQIVIKDEPLKAFNISGTFSSTDPVALLKFLRAQPGIRVNDTGAHIEIALDSQPPAD